MAIDGTKGLANASKHTAMSHAHVEKSLRQVDLEIVQLLAKAEQADYEAAQARRDSQAAESKTPKGRPPK